MPSPRRPLAPFAITLLLALAPCARAGAASPARAVAPRASASRPAARPVRRAPAGDLYRDTLAWVGPRAITAADLVERIEMMPWPDKARGAPMDSARVHALQSLAAEALLAGEAERLGLGEGGAIARMREALRRALARDALYHAVVDTLPAPAAATVDRLARARGAALAPAARRALLRTVADSLRGLDARERAAGFMRETLAPQRAVVDSAAFRMLADSLRSLMLADRGPPGAPGPTTLLPGYVDALLARLGPALERPLVRLADGDLRLGDVLESIRFYVLPLEVHGRARFAVELNAQLRTVVEGELMAREALRRHLDERPEVKRDLALWTTAWRAQLLLLRVASGPPASDDDAFRRLALTEPERARAITEVDLEEILSESAEQARAVRARLDGGALFDSLARALTRRDAWRAQGGRSGFFPVRRLPQLGYAALLTPLDSLSGPLHLAEGFTVYRVRAKRLVADSTAAPELLEAARDAAEAAARSDRVARYVAGLAARGRVELDYATLPRIEVASIQVLTRRTLGFGGGMLAVPSLTPLWDWVPLWRAAHTALP